MDHLTPLIRYPPSNNSLLSSGNTKKTMAYEPRTEAISPAINDDIINTEDSTSKSTKDEQTLLVEKLKKVEAEILQTDLQISRLRKQKAQLEQAASSASNDDDDQENVCDTKQLSIAKLVYHENRAKAQKAHAKFGGFNRDLPLYNQPSDNPIYHHTAAKFVNSFKTNLIACFRERLLNRMKLEETVSAEYDRRMEKWLKSIEQDDSQPSRRIKDARTREFFERQFPELKKARESGERFSRVGQRVARSDAELDELLDGITEREDHDRKVKSYAVIPPMLEEMRSRKPKYINRNGHVEDIIAEYKEYQILNTWTDEEKEIFRENYLQNPKNFGLIASMTSRKNVANCVQYYYMSKKSENYKQLLKRQQKRRTRSFVRPAQQTPANTNIDEVGEEGAPKNTGTDKETIQDSSNSSCCICNCEFDEKNQSRNVTRSNHQFYGIGVGVLQPGMKICFNCRFRHVRHPSLEESYTSPEPMEEEEDINLMEIDQPAVLSEEASEANQIALTQHNDSPPRQEQADKTNLTETAKPQQPRTCVRDIIYQAIEMSFQKPKTSESIDTPMKIDPVLIETMPNNQVIAQQHPVPAVLPIKPVVPNQTLPTNPLPPQIPIQNLTVPQHQHQFQVQLQQKQQQLQMEYNIRQQFLSQQLHQQQQQIISQQIHQRRLEEQQHQRQRQEQQHQQQVQLAQQQREAQQQQQQRQLQIQQQQQAQQQQQQQQQRQLQLQIQQQQARHEAQQQAQQQAQQHRQNQQPLFPIPVAQTAISKSPFPPAPQNVTLAHPLNLCRKYNDTPVFPEATLRPPIKAGPPPMAHGAKASKAPPPRTVFENGVLNLSKPPPVRHQPLPLHPQPQPPTQMQPQIQSIPQPHQLQPPAQLHHQLQLAPQPPPLPPQLSAQLQLQPPVQSQKPTQSPAPTPALAPAPQQVPAQTLALAAATPQAQPPDPAPVPQQVSAPAPPQEPALALLPEPAPPQPQAPLQPQSQTPLQPQSQPQTPPRPQSQLSPQQTQPQPQQPLQVQQQAPEKQSLNPEERKQQVTPPEPQRQSPSPSPKHEDSRSPSEMVIDESAELRPSPASSEQAESDQTKK